MQAVHKLRTYIFLSLGDILAPSSYDVFIILAYTYFRVRGNISHARILLSNLYTVAYSGAHFPRRAVLTGPESLRFEACSKTDQCPARARYLSQ